MTAINRKIFKINKWSPVSQLFFDLGIFGSIILALNFFDIIPWVLLWFYVIFIIFLSGFIFAKPGSKYNFTLVLGILIVLMFIPSKWGQITLRTYNIVLPPPDNPITKPIEDFANDAEEAIDDYIPDEWKPNEHTDVYYNDNNDGYLPKTEGQKAGEQIIEQQEGGGLSPAPDFTGLYDKIQTLNKNPMKNWDTWITNFMDVVNWIVFIGIACYGLTMIGDAYMMDFEKIAKKGVAIALAITIMTMIYGIWIIANIKVRTVWDTVGIAFVNMLKSIGFAQLDTRTGRVYYGVDTIVTGFFMWIPIFTVLLMFILSFQLRKTHLESILFVHSISKKNYIEVKRTEFSPLVLVMLIGVIVYMTGYFLLTAKPVLTVDPIITLAFYIAAMVILILLGFQILIIHREGSMKSFIYSTFKWTIFGLMGLMLWYNVLTPVFYFLNLTDSNGLLTLSQDIDESILRGSIYNHLFMVAIPESLIFQIGMIGVANRVYYQIFRETISRKYEEYLHRKMVGLMVQKDTLSIKDNISKKNMRNIAKYITLDKEIEKIEFELKMGKEAKKVPFSYFIKPTMIGNLIGAFLFADYHRFRRGIDFISFWKNPSLGLTFFGAGFYLGLIAFFSWTACILVHWLNNIIAVTLFGG